MNDALRSRAGGAVERERSVAAEDLRQPVAEAAGRAEEKKPEQHTEPAAKGAVERCLDERRSEPGQCFLVVTQTGHRFVAAQRIGRAQDGIDVGFDLTRAQRVDQHGDREDQPRKVEEGEGGKQAGEDRSGDDGHEQDDSDAAGAGGVAQAIHPAAKPAVVTPPRKLRHAPDNDEGDENGEET